MRNRGLAIVLVLAALMVRTALMVLVPLKVMAASDGDRVRWSSVRLSPLGLSNPIMVSRAATIILTN